MKSCFVLTLVVFLGSCAGYRFVGKTNPFAQYEIETMTVPMFINHSSLPTLSPAFTKEFVHTVFQMRGLQLVNDRHRADAVLIGIIDSMQSRKETLLPTGMRLAQGVAPESTQEREDFYIPGSTMMNLELRIIIIKHPTAEEVEFLLSRMGEKALPQSKLIFNESFALSAFYNRVVFDAQAGSVNNTQNAGILQQNINLMARQAAENFRDMVLYAF